jgi:hypothetical protein
MDPLKVAARFVAFAFYLNGGTNTRPSPEEAGTYARVHWKQFLPYVHQELGSFLTGPPPSLNPLKGDRPAAARNKTQQRRPPLLPRASHCPGLG